MAIRPAAWPPIALAALLATSAAAQSEFCADPGAACGSALSAECLSRLGAGVTAVESDSAQCREQLAGYRDCIAKAASECGAPALQAGAGCGASQEKEYWALAETDGDCGGYRAFLEVCPASGRAAFARSRMEALGCGLATGALKNTDALPPTAPKDLTDGPSRAYFESYDTVLAALVASLEALDLEIESREESGFGALLYFKKSISLWSWGETGRVAVLRPQGGQVRVVVTSRKRVATQITGTSTAAFAKQIFAELSTRLRESR